MHWRYIRYCHDSLGNSLYLGTWDPRLRERYYTHTRSIWLYGPHVWVVYRLYDCKWKVFKEWCQQRGHLPFYFLSVKCQCNFVISAEPGWQTKSLPQELRCTWLQLQLDIWDLNEKWSNSILWSVDLDNRHAGCFLFPDCCSSMGRGSDFNRLSGAPFEPLKEGSFKHMSLRTGFTLALASAKHLTDIHAHSWIQFVPEYTHGVTETSPCFLHLMLGSCFPIVLTAFSSQLAVKKPNWQVLAQNRISKYWFVTIIIMLSQQFKQYIFSPRTLFSW